jgi:hypothetical protein
VADFTDDDWPEGYGPAPGPLAKPKVDLTPPSWTEDVPPIEAYEVQPQSTDTGPFRLPIELYHQIEPTVEGRWLVKRMLRASAATVVFGLPGCGKSFLVLDWCLSIAAGLD